MWPTHTHRQQPLCKNSSLTFIRGRQREGEDTEFQVHTSENKEEQSFYWRSIVLSSSFWSDCGWARVFWLSLPSSTDPTAYHPSSSIMSNNFASDHVLLLQMSIRQISDFDFHLVSCGVRSEFIWLAPGQIKYEAMLSFGRGRIRVEWGCWFSFCPYTYMVNYSCHWWKHLTAHTLRLDLSLAEKGLDITWS